MKLDSLKKYSPVLLRVSMALVFLYFGISQLKNPSGFIGWIPQELSFISPFVLVIINGIFETIFAIFLLIGLHTRISSLLLAFHLALITFSIGFNEVGVRDFGLTIATTAVFMNGTDSWCLDNLLKKKKIKEK